MLYLYLHIGYIWCFMANPISEHGDVSSKVNSIKTSLALVTPQTTHAQSFSNVKQVQVKPIKMKLYFSIISYVREHKKLPVDLGNRQQLNYYVQRLKRNGILVKKGYGVWDVLKEPKEVQLTPKVDKNIRGHGFHFKLKIPRISNWGKRVDYLIKNQIKYKELKNFQRIEVKNHKVWLCNDSIIIYSPKDKSYFGDSADESQKYAIYNLEQLIISLEHLMNCSFRINKKYQVRISKQHYGKVKDELAKQCNKEGVKIRCSLNGEGWLEIDNSLNLNELETLHPKESVIDMDKVVIPFFNDLKDHYQKTGESIIISDLIKLTAMMVEDRKFYAENMNSHVKAVQELAKGVNELRAKVGKINTAHLNQHQTRLNGW